MHNYSPAIFVSPGYMCTYDFDPRELPAIRYSIASSCFPTHKLCFVSLRKKTFANHYWFVLIVAYLSCIGYLETCWLYILTALHVCAYLSTVSWTLCPSPSPATLSWCMQCSYGSRWSQLAVTVCGTSMTSRQVMEGSVTLWLPSWYKLKTRTHPYQRTYWAHKSARYLFCACVSLCT